MENEMTEMPPTDELLRFFKALADANRLKIVGLLAREEHSVGQLAEMLHLGPSTVSHHLGRLSEAGLVSARAVGYYSLYRLETDALEAKARTLLAHNDLSAVAGDLDLDAYDRKVLNDFLLPDGRLKSLPAQHKKQQAVLRHIVKRFEPGARYSEKQVNEMLRQVHDDTATLRRALVDERLLARQAGEYWRTDQQ